MNKTQELLELITEYPNRELIFMYPEEGSDHPYTLGHPSKILIDEYVAIDDRVWLKEQDGDELFDDIADNIVDEYFYGAAPITTEQETEINKKAGKKINDLKWKRAIVVYIRP